MMIVEQQKHLGLVEGALAKDIQESLYWFLSPLHHREDLESIIYDSRFPDLFDAFNQLSLSLNSADDSRMFGEELFESIVSTDIFDIYIQDTYDRKFIGEEEMKRLRGAYLFPRISFLSKLTPYYSQIFGEQKNEPDPDIDLLIDALRNECEARGVFDYGYVCSNLDYFERRLNENPDIAKAYEYHRNYYDNLNHHRERVEDGWTYVFKGPLYFGYPPSDNSKN